MWVWLLCCKMLQVCDIAEVTSYKSSVSNPKLQNPKGDTPMTTCNKYNHMSCGRKAKQMQLIVVKVTVGH